MQNLNGETIERGWNTEGRHMQQDWGADLENADDAQGANTDKLKEANTLIEHMRTDNLGQTEQIRAITEAWKRQWQETKQREGETYKIKQEMTGLKAKKPSHKAI